LFTPSATKRLRPSVVIPWGYQNRASPNDEIKNPMLEYETKFVTPPPALLKATKGVVGILPGEVKDTENPAPSADP
jgi:hypothetical protein